MKVFSLKGRLNRQLGLALCLVLIAQWFASSLVMRSLFENKLNHDLSTQMDLLTSVLQREGKQWRIDESRVPVLYQRPYSGHYYRVIVGGQLFESRSVWDHDWAKQSRVYRQNYWMGPDGQTLHSASRDFQKQGSKVSLWVAEDVSEFEQDLTRWQLYNAISSSVVLLGFLFFQRYSVAHSMSPLTDIQQQLKALQSGNILQLDEVPLQEIQPLVQEINRLLLALDKRLSRSREAASNLAHSLKTHLGRLQISSDGTPPGFQNELEALNSQLARLIDRETSRMRIQGQGAREFQTDPLPILNALTESLPKLYPEKPLVVSLDADPKVKIPLDPDDLFELGGILLDNACKWARKQIVVSVVSGRLTIEDDGLPPSADLLNVIGTRGVRADQQTKGSGLGLSMAHDIATLYDAELAYDASPQLGGLRVSLSWASLKTNPS